jgi:hypothetical protein
MSLTRDGHVPARERELAEVLDLFAPASAELLAQRKLLRRTDSKFVLAASSLSSVLRELSHDYALVRAGARLLATYKTLYFDTPDLQCFHAHRRGRRPRHKIRLRHYPDRELTFFEIKTKKSEVITQKVRVAVPYGTDTLSEVAHASLRTHAVHGLTPSSTFEPQLWTNFHRLTLLGLRTEERVTIDVDLRVGPSELLVDVGEVVILEVKQAFASRCTPVMSALRSAGLRPASASKYCTGIALTRAGVPLNRLLPALRMLGRFRA